MQGVITVATSGGGCVDESMSTVSKDDNNLVLSSEDSSCPDESELELGLGLSLSQPAPKSHNNHHHNHHHHHHGPYARILTAKDFPSSASSSSPSSSSSSSPSSMSRANTTTAGTKRTADSVAANNGPRYIILTWSSYNLMFYTMIF